MGLYDGPSAMACEERCREADLLERIRKGRERVEAPRNNEAPAPASPQALRAETADSAVSTVETAVASNGTGGRVWSVLSRLWSERKAAKFK